MRNGAANAQTSPMKESQNPYAAPKAILEAFPPRESAGLWRAGRVLVCRRDAVFPHRCVKCNQAATPPLRRYKLSWHHPLWYLLIILYVLPYVLVRVLVRRHAEISVALCERHQRRLHGAQMVGWGGFAAIMLAFVLGVSLGHWEVAGIGLLAVPIWLIALFVLLPQLTAARITKEEIRIRGCGRDFLDSLPEHLG